MNFLSRTFEQRDNDSQSGYTVCINVRYGKGMPTPVHKCRCSNQFMLHLLGNRVEYRFHLQQDSHSNTRYKLTALMG